MDITDEKVPGSFKALEEASKPMIDFLYKYGCPHSTIIITQTSVELCNGECGMPIEPRD
jgi:hypothetical protein